MLAGHLGVSVLAHRYLKADLVPVVVAGVIPDVVDKALCQGLHLLPNGRMWGHTLLGLAVSTVLVRLLWGRQTAWSWAVGYLGHLVADLGRASAVVVSVCAVRTSSRRRASGRFCGAGWKIPPKSVWNWRC